jgi:hypothetical protein
MADLLLPSGDTTTPNTDDKPDEFKNAVDKARTLIQTITTNADNHNNIIDGIVGQIEKELNNFDTCIDQIDKIKEENENLKNKIEELQTQQKEELESLKTQTKGERDSALKANAEASMENIRQIINELETLKNKLDTDKQSQVEKLENNVKSIRSKIEGLCQNIQKETTISEEDQRKLLQIDPNNPKPPNAPLPKLELSPKDKLYKILTDGIYNFKFHSTFGVSMKKKELQNMINELNSNVMNIPRGTMTQKISKIITNLQSIINVKADKNKKEFLIKIIEELYQMRLKTPSNISVRDFWTQKLNEVRDQVKNIPDNRKSNTQNPYRITFREFITKHYYNTPIYYDNNRVLDANNKNTSGHQFYGGFRYGKDLDRILRNSPLRSLDNKSPSKKLTLKSKSKTKSKSVSIKTRKKAPKKKRKQQKRKKKKGTAKRKTKNAKIKKKKKRKNTIKRKKKGKR